jgi:iron complex outermembrane recepter protein
LIWGVGYRRSADQTVGTIDQAFIPSNRAIQLFNVFLQDEITLKPYRWFLTAGTKIEHNDFNGFEFEPSVRVAWTPSNRRTLWAAVSSAARTPPRTDVNGDFNVAVFPGPGGTPAELAILGNPHENSEHLIATEAGYRAQVSRRSSIDLAMFFNSYKDLRTVEPAAPFFETDPIPHLVIPLVFSNKMHGTTDGLEVAATWKVNSRWTLSPGYALLQVHLHIDSTSQDTTTVGDIQGWNPHHRQNFDLTWICLAALPGTQASILSIVFQRNSCLPIRDSTRS